MDKFKTGDKVYVINWGKQYSKIGGGNGVFFECPNYLSTQFFWKTVTKPRLTLKGVPFKNGEVEVVERIPEFKNYKYKIIDWMYHPDNDKQVVCLIKSDNGCYVEIGEEGLSLLTPEQYADNQFDALKEAHKGRWTVDMRSKANKEFPDKLKGIIYDKNDRVLFGSSYTRGKITYSYVPAEFTVDGIPFIISSSCLYDGKGNSDLPEDAEMMHFNELKEKFTNNQFNG